MWKRISGIVIPTLIAVAIIAYMLYRVWDDLIVALEHIVPGYLVPAVLICIAAWILRGGRYRYILEGLGVTVGLWLSTATIFISQTANLIVPARLGDLVRMVILKHERETPYSRGLSSLVVERVFDIVIVAVLGVFALPFVLNVPDFFLPLIVIPLVGGGIFVIVLLSAGRIRSENRYIRMVIGLCDEMRAASLNPAALAILSISSLFIWLVDAGVCAAVALMFQEQIPFVVIVLAIVIGNLVKAVPVTPGGVGTYELSVALTLVLAGISPAVATLIAVIDHLIKNLVTLAGGVASLYAFGDWSVALLRRAFSQKLNVEEFS